MTTQEIIAIRELAASSRNYHGDRIDENMRAIMEMCAKYIPRGPMIPGWWCDKCGKADSIKCATCGRQTRWIPHWPRT